MYRGEVKQRTILSMLAVFLILICCFSGCGLSVAPKVGALAPGFTLPTLDGQTVSLDEMRGQPVVLNFWATWCRPCCMEMPYLQEAFNQKGEEVRFIAINLGESEGRAREFAQDMGISFIIALDQNGGVGSAYNIRGIPTTFFIDKKGIICHIRGGAFGSEDELMVLLEGL